MTQNNMHFNQFDVDSYISEHYLEFTCISHYGNNILQSLNINILKEILSYLNLNDVYLR